MYRDKLVGFQCDIRRYPCADWVGNLVDTEESHCFGKRVSLVGRIVYELEESVVC